MDTGVHRNCLPLRSPQEVPQQDSSGIALMLVMRWAHWEKNNSLWTLQYRWPSVTNAKRRPGDRDHSGAPALREEGLKSHLNSFIMELDL